MNAQAIINEVNRENAGIRPKIEQISNNMQTLDKSINDADQNWDDHKKQEFFGSHIAEIHQAYNTQINAMKNVDAIFRDGENTIFSMI